jgi:hypothetical protein
MVLWWRRRRRRRRRRVGPSHSPAHLMSWKRDLLVHLLAAQIVRKTRLRICPRPALAHTHLYLAGGG